MFNFAVFLAPLALVLPFAMVPDDAVSDEQIGAASIDRSGNEAGRYDMTPDPPLEHTALSLDGAIPQSAARVPVQHQIRIERRVVIRISPYRPSSRATRANLNADAPRQRVQRKLVERKAGKCVPMKSIAAVRTTQDDRLLLYMNDQRLFAANLEKACSAREFYQGFYVEPSKDGNLCVERDRLQSRTGAKCKMRRIRQLVPETT